jgi:hypothetical protein
VLYLNQPDEIVIFSLTEMSLNPQAEGKSLYDVLEGSVSSYYTRLAGVLQRNESVNGQYRSTVSSCYGGNTPVRIPNFTRVCISTNGSTIVDLANSFIEMHLKYKFHLNRPMPEINSQTPLGSRVLFVGFKNSLEALSRYDIYVNSNKIYSQSWVGQESFVYNAGVSQTLRESNRYVYTAAENVYKYSPDVCGTYVVFDNEESLVFDFEVEIPVKINLHQILMLSSVRYLPSFCGRWEIELYPNWNNIVVMQVPFEATCHQSVIEEFDDKPDWRTFRSFTQIGKRFQFGELFTEQDGIQVEYEQKLTCNEGTLTQCLLNLTTFQLRYEVFEGLRQMYTEQPLIIPVNILTYNRFSGQPGDNLDGTIFHATLSQSLENVDSIFILVPTTNDQTTCFYQPYLREVRMNMGEFGTHPARYVQTWNDIRFLAMCLDALNLETSEITAMNHDVRSSFNWVYTKCVVDGDDSSANYFVRDQNSDHSNFFIGISLSQIGFQSGTVSSPNTNVPFIFDATLDRHDAGAASEELETSIIMMTLIDAALMIQVIPDSDIPVVKLTSKSIV